MGVVSNESGMVAKEEDQEWLRNLVIDLKKMRNIEGSDLHYRKSLWLQWRLQITWVQTGGKKSREKSNRTRS